MANQIEASLDRFGRSLDRDPPSLLLGSEARDITLLLDERPTSAVTSARPDDGLNLAILV
jgi:hypothetical protein